jgi:hypothetical protein
MTSPVFLLTPPPRVVTARMVPVRVSITGSLVQGTGTLDRFLGTGQSIRHSSFDEFALAHVQQVRHLIEAVDQRGVHLGAHLAQFGSFVLLDQVIDQTTVVDAMRQGLQLQNLKLDYFVEVHGFLKNPKADVLNSRRKGKRRQRKPCHLKVQGF